jgi:DNA-binding NarL/FixJ family response regulator
MTVRLVIADDHTLFAQALKRVLEPRYEVVEIVGDGKALQLSARKHKPDVVVTDMTMPLMNGLDSARVLAKEAYPPKFVFLTMHADSELARECLRSGGSAFVLKESSYNELSLAIDTVMSNHNYISPKIAASLLDPPAEKDNGEAGKLTPRQREILQLLAEGRTMKEIAKVMDLSTRTIEWHKYKMMKILSVRRTSQLIQHALRIKLVL